MFPEGVDAGDHLILVLAAYVMHVIPKRVLLKLGDYLCNKNRQR